MAELKMAVIGDHFKTVTYRAGRIAEEIKRYLTKEAFLNLC